MKFQNWPKNSVLPVSLAVMLNILIIISGVLFYNAQKKVVSSNVYENLGIIADLKIKSINEWLEQRKGTLFSITTNPFFYEYFLKYKTTGSDHFKEELGSWMESLLKDDNFDQVILFDENKVPLLFFPAFQPLVKSDTWSRIKSLMDTDSLHLIDIYESSSNEFRMGFVANIGNPSDPGMPACHLFLRINPDHFLYPYLNDWPGKSESAETLIGRKEGDSVVFLNRLKFYNGSPLDLKISVQDTTVAMIKGVSGFVGVTEARDYRGMEVIAAVRKVTQTPWIMVARQDKSEVYQLLKSKLLFLILGVSGIMILLTGIILQIFRSQGMRYYRQAYHSERERNWLYYLIEQSLNEIYVFREDNLRFTYVNKGGLNNIGYTPEELAEMTPVMIKPLINDEQFEQMIEPLRSGESNLQRFTTVHRRKNGTDYPVEVYLQLMESQHGKVFLAVINDITERLKAENQLQAQQTELELKNLELSRMNERLKAINEDLQFTNKELLNAKEQAEKANHLKSRFLANMSHEIRTPLNGILGFAELLYESSGNTDQTKMAEIIISSGSRLLDTVNSVLDASALESGNIVVKILAVDIGRICAEASELYTALAQKKGLEVINEVPPNLIVQADETLVLKIVNNLVNNALKFTTKGPIRIASVSESFDGIRHTGIQVIDNGIGIPDEELDAIFEEFKQSSEGLSKKHSGSGLGLYISRRFAMTMGGRITVNSKQGEGSTFTLWLPAANVN
jgi:PAS domain S-box-containing protein